MIDSSGSEWLKVERENMQLFWFLFFMDNFISALFDDTNIHETIDLFKSLF